MAAVVDTDTASQVTNCRGTSKIGCPLRIRRQTTTLPVTLIVAEVPHGLPEAAHSMSGIPQDHSCGSMVNVCLQNFRLFAGADRAPDPVAGSGKSILWYVIVV